MTELIDALWELAQGRAAWSPEKKRLAEEVSVREDRLLEALDARQRRLLKAYEDALDEMYTLTEREAFAAGAGAFAEVRSKSEK